jgi:ADP-ribosylglycohydrolase
VEFTSREERKDDLVTDMREYGTHNQPIGTWSDDSSMALATLDSIVKNKGIVYEDIMKRFREWTIKGAYTPHGRVFDIGITCAEAIERFWPGRDPLTCGADGERDNGNGSLMRIMPVSLYDALDEDFWNADRLEKAAENTHNVSSLTHRYPRSLTGCMSQSTGKRTASA